MQLQFNQVLIRKMLMLIKSETAIQPKSTVALKYIWPREFTGLLAATLAK